MELADADVRAMIKESSEMWLSMNRSEAWNAVLIAHHLPHCLQLTWPEGATEWKIEARELTVKEIGLFFAEFGAQYMFLLGSYISFNGQAARVRKFVFNGRARRWVTSIDLNGGFQFRLDKTKQALRFENETETDATVIIEPK